MNDLFDSINSLQLSREVVAEGATLLRARALPVEGELLTALQAILARAPYRHMMTPGGFTMSVATTNCGDVGWVTDRHGYRYDHLDPDSGHPWQPMPDCLLVLAGAAAAEAGYASFVPDACLINRYAPSARLSLHQDRNERDFSQPIVSVSLGLPATFLFGGPRRTDATRKIWLCHGDVVVWGGPSRLWFHGIAALKDGEHPGMGRTRINLTLRKAL